VWYWFARSLALIDDFVSPRCHWHRTLQKISYRGILFQWRETMDVSCGPLPREDAPAARNCRSFIRAPAVKIDVPQLTARWSCRCGSVITKNWWTEETTGCKATQLFDACHISRRNELAPRCVRRELLSVADWLRGAIDLILCGIWCIDRSANCRSRISRLHCRVVQCRSY